MTNFAIQSTLGPAAPLVSKDKGNFGNRMNCAGEHIKNSVTTAAQGAAAGLVAYNAATAVLRNMSGRCGLTKILAKGFDYAMDGIGKLTKIPNLKSGVTNSIAGHLNKFIDKSSVPGLKALAVIASIALPVFGYIAHNHSYKSGQIDQKYTDQAALQKTL